MLLYNQLPGLRGEGEAWAIQSSLQQSVGTISLHSEPVPVCNSFECDVFCVVYYSEAQALVPGASNMLGD